MVGFWPSRKSDVASSEVADSVSAAGIIEMKGSEHTSVPKGKPPTLAPLWPASRWSSMRRAKPAERSAKASGSRVVEDAAGSDLLEAVVQANIPTVLMCSPRGVEISPRPDPVGAALAQTATSSLALSVSEPEAGLGNEQDYHEVQLVFRVPRVQPGNCGPDSLDRSLEEITEELALKERERSRAADALATKTRECENLLRVVRELTESRNRLSGVKVVQSERLADLQHEYMRLARVADLSRAVSRENMAKSAHISQRLNQVEEELAHQKALNQQTKERHTRLNLENIELRERLCLLERLDVFAYRAESACMLNFQSYHLKETY